MELPHDWEIGPPKRHGLILSVFDIICVLIIIGARQRLVKKSDADEAVYTLCPAFTILIPALTSRPISSSSCDIALNKTSVNFLIKCLKPWMRRTSRY